jgi:hypothetical protein
MKFSLATLFILFFNNATCFASCAASATQTETLTFAVVTQGSAGTYTIQPTDQGAAVVVTHGQTPGKNVTPSIENYTGQICMVTSPSTCLTVGTHTILPNVATPAGADGTVTAKIGATVTVLPDSPAGTYAGSPSTAVFTCED